MINNSLTTGQSYSLPGSITGTATKIDVWITGHPNNLLSRTFVAESGWREGLPVATEDWTSSTSGWTKERWTWTNYTQDDVALAYPLNPRGIESRVGDSTNIKKTAVDYYLYPNTTIAKYGRASEMRVYDTDLTTILKKVKTEYEDGTAYTSRRLLGLPVKTELYGRETSGLNLMSKMTYVYDEGNFGDSSLSQNISPIQHDSSFGTSFITGRGNLTSTKRWDVVNSTNEALAVTSSIKYNTAGSPVAQITPWDGTNTRTVKIEYTDNFNSTPSVATYAYPTTLTDPAGFSSTVKYRYDIGTNIWAQSPDINSTTSGKETERLYDTYGRLSKNTVVNNGAYTRYEYPTSGIHSKVYSTIIDGGTVGADAGDEVLSESWTDGAGRVLKSRVPHTFSGGTTATWAGTKIEYDIIGRPTAQSVPTEVNSSWTPAGDDAGHDFLWTRQKYDWKGRVVRKINTDGTDSSTLNDSDVLISYEGCGCAGGQITTVESEKVPVPGQSYSARRIQKVYEDIQGRTFKSEALNWDGTNVYTSTEQKFNGRDQVIESIHYAGPVTSTTHQSTIATYDGHGRLKTQHVPQQSANTNTIFDYYADDRLHVKTDARGATSTMTYDNRGLLTGVENEWPGAPAQSNRKNFALAENGSTATASSQHSDNFSVWGAVNGDRKGNNWASNGGWNDGSQYNYPDWLQVQFSRSKTIDEISVFTVQDNIATAGEPTESTTFTQGGLTDYSVEYWDGTNWTAVTGGSVSGNNKVWRKFQFSPVTTTKIRVFVTGSLVGYSRIIEVEAWGPDTPPPVNTEVEYTYDNIGNRISMTDSSGSTEYVYNSLSQLTAETRAFNDTLSAAPLSNNRFKLEYTYDLSGALKSLKDPFGEEINYGYDKTGRLDEVTGSTYGGVTDYADNAHYRAWGGLSGLSYGNGVTMSSTFNNRLLPDHYELKKGTTDVMKKNYQYNPDGKLKYLQDQLNDKFDRLNIYDQLGRIKEGKTGLEARGGSVTTNQSTDLPYRQSYAFNEFNNMTARNNLHWGTENWYGQANNLSYTYQNNRITNTGWQHDADGRVTQSFPPDDWATSTYDARGLLIKHHVNDNFSSSYGTIQRFYNGDGREVKRGKVNYAEIYDATQWPLGTWSEEEPTYYIRSSVLGGEVVSETYGNGGKKKTFVLAAGAKIATQSEYTYFTNTTESVSFDHNDAAGMSYRSSTSTGDAVTADGQFDGAPAEFDPLGGNAGLATPYIEQLIQPPPPSELFPFFQNFGDSPMYVNGQQVSCTLDGMSIGCSSAFSMLGHSADIDFANTSSWVLSQLGIFAVQSYEDYVDDSPAPDPNAPFTIQTVERRFLGYEYFFSGSFWGPQIQPPQSQPAVDLEAGGGKSFSAARKPSKEKILAAINECIKKVFKAQKLTATDIVAAGGKGSDGRLDLTNSAGAFSIATGTAFNISQIQVAWSRSAGYVDDTFPLQVIGGVAGGFTPSRTSGTFVVSGRTYSNDGRRANYIGYNAGGSGHPLEGLLGINYSRQIHEDGHSIANNLGGVYDGGWTKDANGNTVPSPTEWGRNFQDCVFAEILKPGSYNP